MRRNFLLLVLPLLLGLAVSVGWAQERAATYYAMEGQIGSAPGSIAYIDEAKVLHEDVLKIPANGVKTPGAPLLRAGFYNGKIYAVSRQVYNGQLNRLVRINPTTWEIEQMGGDGFSDIDGEVSTHHFLGVNDKLGYLSSSASRIYRVKLDDLSVLPVVGGGWDGLSNREVGSMLLYRGRIIVEVFGDNSSGSVDVSGHELWVLKVEDGAVVGKFSAKGLFNPVVTMDGRLVAVRAQPDGSSFRYSLVELDVNKPLAEPIVLLQFADSVRPADSQTQRGRWSQNHLFASTRENRLFWNVYSKDLGMNAIATMHLDKYPLTPHVVYKSGGKRIYGITRENPHDGSLWTNLVDGPSSPSVLSRIALKGENYEVESDYTSSASYGFASCPFFKDEHPAKVANSSPIAAAIGDELDLCDYVVDKDGFSASVLFSDMVTTPNTKWKFELVDNHIIKVIAKSKKDCVVQLKAFSSGVPSRIRLKFTLPAYTMTVDWIGKGYVTIKDQAGNIRDKYADLRGGDLFMIEPTAVADYELLPENLHVTGAEKQPDGLWKVTGDVHITAIFTIKLKQCTVTMVSSGEGTLVVKDDESVVLHDGDKVTRLTPLYITATAGANWVLKPENLVVNGATKQADGVWKVRGDVSIKVTFTPIEYTLVAISHEGEGALVVKNADGKELKQGDKVAYGTMLSVETTPATGYELVADGVKVEGAEQQADGQWKVTGDVTIKVAFSLKQFTITEIAHEGEGSLVVKNADGKEFKQGDKVAYGTIFSVEANPSTGYELVADGVKVEGAEKQPDGKWKVTDDVTINVTFTPIEYTLIAISHEGEGSLAVKDAVGKDFKQGDKVAYGTMLTVVATAADGYELLTDSLKVAGAAKQSDGSWKVTGDVTIKVTFTEKAKTPPATGPFKLKSIEVVSGKGSVEVNRATGEPVKINDQIASGELLIITQIAAEGYEVCTGCLSVKGANKEGASWRVVGDVEIQVKFEKKEAQPSNIFKILSIEQIGKGEIVVTNQKNERLAALSQVAEGDVLTIVGKPAEGYELPTDWLTVTGATKQTDGTWLVAGDLTIKVTFRLKGSELPTAVESVLLADAQAMPNPFTGVLQVRASGVVARCTVWNTMGQMLYSLEHPGTDFVLDLSYLPSALYLLRLEDELGGVRELRVVKQ